MLYRSRRIWSTRRLRRRLRRRPCCVAARSNSPKVLLVSESIRDCPRLMFALLIRSLDDVSIVRRWFVWQKTAQVERRLAKSCVAIRARFWSTSVVVVVFSSSLCRCTPPQAFACRANSHRSLSPAGDRILFCRFVSKSNQRLSVDNINRGL